MGSHPLVAALLSALIPGAGQLYVRRPVRAVVFFFPTILIAFGGFEFASRSAVELAALFVRPSFLSSALIVNILILGWRLLAVVDAYRLTGSTGDRSWMTTTVALLLLAVAIPHLIAWSYGTQALHALETVFVAGSTHNGIVVRSPTPDSFLDLKLRDATRIDTPDQDSPPRGPSNFRPEIDSFGAVTTTTVILPPLEPGAPFPELTERLALERLTILLVGADAGPGREGIRTDTMIVATFDLATGEVALFGLPRNFKLVPLPRNLRNSFRGLEERVIEKDLTDADEDGYPDAWIDSDGDGVPEEPPFDSCHCFPTMLNKVHQYTDDWTKTYPNVPDPGLAALKDVIAHLIDLPIDYAVMVEMDGFVKAIDAIGGVDVLVKKPYHVKVSAPSPGSPKATINVEPGMNHLDGLESLAYVRWRIGSSDYDRMRRQRCLIRAATTQAGTLELLLALPKLIDMVEASITTDIPLDFLPELIEIAATVDFDNVATVGLVPPTYSAGRTPGKYPIPNASRIRWKVQQLLEEGVTAQSSAGESECDG